MTKTMNANLKPEKSKSLKSNAHVESAPIYLKLYHGRDAVNEKLADWGYDGPTFGPLTQLIVCPAGVDRPERRKWLEKNT